MSSVGTGLNAIFSRMGNIKLARLKDYQNSGEDLSDVETVLTGEGISLRDKTDKFRNFGDVLDEVAGKWTSYSDVSQRAIAKAMAGKQRFVPEHTVTYECRLQNIALRMVPYRERARDGEFRGKTDILRCA